jgi:resuscitation-promoting factor RpfB
MPPSVKTPVGDAPVVPLFLIGAGMYLSWFGVHYWRSDVKWPTDPIKAVLQGKGLPADTQTPTAEEVAVVQAAQKAGTGISGSQGAAAATTASGTIPGVTPAAPNTTGATNQATGKLLAAGYGWATGNEWNALVLLWDQESGWDNRIWNGGSHAATQPAGSSGAYGIAQSLPYTKYPKPGWPPGYGGSADPTSQISWGLAYIKSTYGTPSAAWAHETSAGWY